MPTAQLGPGAPGTPPAPQRGRPVLPSRPRCPPGTAPVPLQGWGPRGSPPGRARSRYPGSGAARGRGSVGAPGWCLAQGMAPVQARGWAVSWPCWELSTGAGGCGVKVPGRSQAP